MKHGENHPEGRRGVARAGRRDDEREAPRYGGWDPTLDRGERRRFDRRGDRFEYPHAGPEMSYGPRYGFGGWEERPSGEGGGQDLEERARRSVPPGQQGHRHEQEFDADYRAWRAEQIRKLDEDYGHWCRERRRRFAAEFEDWRKNRKPEADEPGSGR